MKVLVTGSTGFVGSHVCEHLERRGHEVWALYRSESKRQEFAAVGRGVHGTLSTDLEQPNAWLDRLPSDLDAVVHVAGLTSSFRCEDFFRVNTTATRRLTLGLRQRWPQLRFVLVSSLAAAGPSVDPPKVESDPPAPVSRYGQSKLEAERAVDELAPEDWSVAIVRPPIVMGPRDPGMLDVFKMVRNRMIVLPGLLGRFKRYSFVGVGDLSELIGRCVEHAAPNARACYFPAFPRTVSFLELVTAIRLGLDVRWAARVAMPMPVLWTTARLGALLAAAGFPRAIPLTPDKIREARQRGWVCSSQRSVDELKMEYREDLEPLVARCGEDYRQRGWL